MKNQPVYNFHISKKARDKYSVQDTLFSIKGRVLFVNFTAAKLLAESINSKRNIKKNPELGASPGMLNAMGLIDEILHFIIDLYKKRVEENLFDKLREHSAKAIGEKRLTELLEQFVTIFPNNQVYNGELNAKNYLKSKTEGSSNQEIVIEEMLVTWIQNQNAAYKNLKELIDDAELNQTITYKRFNREAQKFFRKIPGLNNSKVSLIEMLLLPAQLYPDSVFDQLKYMHDNWGDEIKGFLSRILISLDFIKEESIRYSAEHFGNPESVVVHFGDDYFEPEAFSEDKDWMPHLVLIAKSTFVWLDQLSKQYQREINTLDKIPDEELNRLANYGFTGLWLIGLWERSHASQKIKQINGNPEAVASAYSLKNYGIASDLGGFEAYQNLKERAWKRGIRLASDMVPNHMAIDSDWVRNHPHWFIHSEHPPFPGHTFNGPDLSDQDNMYVHIEDGYWNKSDAAVAFKRVDKQTGHTLYIYHGNDGTGMPWNDTAQLNYLLPEVREAVLNTIIHVAHLFPIIRFDAAMTLAKKHYQRLWFPVPGSGGDIPSRSEYAMSKEEFDRVFPVEFWREVVDRVAQECPDTLLLAEAFWMMEGYFVRTLGMHRVYNSAFMNMLKNEENDKYREMIRNVLEFNPQILKRYVNFMNNPDEKTAVEQFGKDDKYFGVCMLMCTMPGLPMFGHGQIEGHFEKYGMEYKRAYWDEKPDTHLIDRHRMEIFPLLKRRKLFSEVQNFCFYNFANAHGVNENVFAYTNQFMDQKVLVLYNNVYDSTTGWIKNSVGFNDGSDKIIHKSFTDALHLNGGDDYYSIFSDSFRSIEYIRKNAQLSSEGFYAELKGYNYQVYFIREVKADNQNPYDQLYAALNGAAVVSVEESVHEIKIAPVIEALKNIFSQQNLKPLTLAKKSKQSEIKKAIRSLDSFKSEIHEFEHLSDKSAPDLSADSYIRWADFVNKKKTFSPAISKNLSKIISDKNKSHYTTLNVIISLVRHLLPGEEGMVRFNFFNNWRIQKAILKDPILEINDSNLIRLIACLNTQILFEEQKEKALLIKFFQRKETAEYLEINLYEGIYYLNKERWEDLVRGSFLYSVFSYLSGDKITDAKLKTFINRYLKRCVFLERIAGDTGYDIDRMIQAITQS